MAFGRRRARGSLLQTAARTAVITGTAAATSNAVHGKAAAREQAAQAAAAPAVAPVAAAPVAAVPATTGVSLSTIEQLERLGALHASGVLTDAEFATLKAQAIG
ncbi:SHOCT domain-containing protein [Plantibacter flavus]|uniref:SHOCT domain-containing protein n=1 Tax=Plantibacter flavus TaxID=150123 RepID=UPI003F1806FE